MIPYEELADALDRWNRRRQGLPEPAPARTATAPAPTSPAEDYAEEVSAAGGFVIESEASVVREDSTNELDLDEIVQ